MGLRFGSLPPLGGVKTAQQFWWGPAAKRISASFRLRTKLRFVNACLHPAAKHSLASFRLRTKLCFVNACLHPAAKHRLASFRLRTKLCFVIACLHPAAKHSLASFRLRTKLRFVNACLHPAAFSERQERKLLCGGGYAGATKDRAREALAGRAESISRATGLTRRRDSRGRTPFRCACCPVFPRNGGAAQGYAPFRELLSSRVEPLAVSRWLRPDQDYRYRPIPVFA